MKRLLPAPLLSLTLFAFWLLLNQSLHAAHLLLGLVLGLLIPLLTRSLRPLPVRIRRPAVVLRLLLTVLYDSLQSNVAVTRMLLRAGPRRHPSAFVPVELDLRWP